jgi:hypothetical protein
MQINTQTKHTIVFKVVSYIAQEGGMDYEEFGHECETLNQAVTLWDLALVGRPNLDWIIQCDVTKEINEV